MEICVDRGGLDQQEYLWLQTHFRVAPLEEGMGHPPADQVKLSQRIT
jgi:hypothetical protein